MSKINFIIKHSVIILTGITLFLFSCSENPEKDVKRYAKKNMDRPIEIIEMGEIDSIYSPYEEKAEFEKIRKEESAKRDTLFNLIEYEDMSKEQREIYRKEMNESVALEGRTEKRLDSLLLNAPVDHKAVRVRYVNKGAILSQAKALYFVYGKNSNKITHVLEEDEVNKYNLLRN